MKTNGLNHFGFHAKEQQYALRYLRPRKDGASRSLLARRNKSALARHYLDKSIASKTLPQLTNPAVNGKRSDFELIGISESPIKKTTIARYRQTSRGVPVYGSLVTVEMDPTGELVVLNSALGEPHGVSPKPKLTPAEAERTVRDYAVLNNDAVLEAPKLAYYFVPASSQWHLVYRVKDVFCNQPTAATGASLPPLADFVIDAHDGSVIEVLSRICGADALDALNRPRHFETSYDVVSSGQQLQNATLNVITRDFGFQDVATDNQNLPGNTITAPPIPWNSTAVSAHANAEIVATFLLRVLGLRGPNGAGGPFISSINCVWAQMGGVGRHWPNSFWVKDQVVFGQRQAGNQFRSFAAALDMVGHEFFHGVIQNSHARFVFTGQTGALNESYSDIFGVLIANHSAPNWEAYRWEVGTDTGQSLRDMSNPNRPPFGHPAHMSDYRNLPGDAGGIHVNCGIHNKAAFNIMTARDAQNRYLFPPQFIAQLFFHALSELGPTSLFAHSRAAVLHQAQIGLKNDPLQAHKLGAIADGFAAAGIL